jgi:aminoglycoside 6'-N-acetyltransferase
VPADGIMSRVDVIAAGDRLVIRRMCDVPDEYERMVRWRNEPHVREWWDPDDPPMTTAAAVREYRPLTDPASSTTACIIEEDGRPIGYVQFYPWGAEPEEALALGVSFDERAWGLDIFIGEPSRVGRGVGSRAVDLVCGYLFSERGATSVELVAAQANDRALGAYAKAGFHRARRVLDTDTKDGQRVESSLMVREPPAL